MNSGAKIRSLPENRRESPADDITNLTTFLIEEKVS
jgi:hypothetical protein